MDLWASRAPVVGTLLMDQGEYSERLFMNVCYKNLTDETMYLRMFELGFSCGSNSEGGVSTDLIYLQPVGYWSD